MNIAKIKMIRKLLVEADVVHLVRSYVPEEHSVVSLISYELLNDPTNIVFMFHSNGAKYTITEKMLDEAVFNTDLRFYVKGNLMFVLKLFKCAPVCMSSSMKIQIANDDFYNTLEKAINDAGGAFCLENIKKLTVDQFVDIFARNGLRVVYDQKGKI